jgi:hypothetical protein
MPNHSGRGFCVAGLVVLCACVLLRLMNSM